MSNPDSNDSDFDNTVVEKLTFKHQDDSDNDQQEQQLKQIQIESDTITGSTTASTAGTTPVPTIAEGDEENLSNSGSSSSNNSSPKLTAEWTVHAQLTFRNKKPGEKITKEFTNLNSTNNSDPNNPIKVFYKWSSNDNSTKDPTTDSNKSNLEKENSTTTTTTTSEIGTETGTGTQKSSRIPLSTKRDRYEKKRLGSLGKGQTESFRSTTTTADSGNCSNKSPRKPPKYGTRCKSTCNIILSAVADFLPSSKTGNVPSDSEPFTFNTTATYTVSPEQETRDIISNQASQNQFSFSKICSLRDAFSQTSDTETKYLGSTQYPGYGVHEQIIDSVDMNSKRNLKPYQQRRHTDSVMSTPIHRKTSSLPIEGGNSFMPSSFISPPQTHKSPSLPKIPPLPTQMLQNLANQAVFGSTLESGTGGSSSKSDTKKPPRTVHIDVYCTGSDEEDDEEDDLDLSMSSEENKHDMESNSTPQTVLDTEQMILKHQRAGKSDLPRKFLNQQQQLKQQQQELHKFETSPSGLQQSRSSSNIRSQNPQLVISPQLEDHKSNIILNVGHAITKSTTAEEISESKQLLFKKHIGDQRNSKLTVRNNKHLHKDMSDDAISSNYPNSSRSTMRDMTCSSISSKAMSSLDMESSWKETEISVGRTDSFDYDNNQDRIRIQKMEKLWSGSSGEQSFYQPDNFDPEDYQRLNYRSVQPSPETPPFRNNSPQKSYFSPNRSPDVSFRNQSPQKYNLNSPSHLYSSQQGHSYSTPPQQPYPSPGGQLFAQIVPNYNASPQPYLGPIHPPTSTRPMSPHQSRIQQFLHGYSQQTNEIIQHEQWKQRQDADYELFPEASKNSYYGFSNQTIPERDERANSKTNSPNYIQETSQSSVSQQSSSNPNKYSTMPHYLSHQFARAQRYGSEDRNPFDLSDKRARVMFTADYNKSGSESSTLQSNLSGYTTEYLAKARRFGSVVTQMRKPGHHVGPAKNPDCECEHCRHWFHERSEQQKGGEARGRAYSMGDTPKGVFWLRRSHN